MIQLPEFVPDPSGRWRLLVHVRCGDGMAAAFLAACRQERIPVDLLPVTGQNPESLQLLSRPETDCDRLLLDISALLAGKGWDCDIVETRLLPATGKPDEQGTAGEIRERYGLDLAFASFFGSGGHPSTRLIAALLAEVMRVASPPATVLDLGCGSGILALVAARLGAGRILAVDVDPGAVDLARGNVRRNRLGGIVAVECLDLGAVTGSFALVLANLPAGVLVRHGGRIAGLTAPGGRLLVSGLMTGQRAGVLAALAGCRLEEERNEGGWLALSLIREE
ncbi:MAG: 50S ribosomal protein L11 methyltransferase [Thermodesulfobacteriota bacterium]